MYKPNGKSHVRAAFKMSYEHVDVRGLSHFCVHTPSLCAGRPSRRVGILSGRAVGERTHTVSKRRHCVRLSPLVDSRE